MTSDLVEQHNSKACLNCSNLAGQHNSKTWLNCNNLAGQHNSKAWLNCRDPKPPFTGRRVDANVMNYVYTLGPQKILQTVDSLFMNSGCMTVSFLYDPDLSVPKQIQKIRKLIKHMYSDWNLSNQGEGGSSRYCPKCNQSVVSVRNLEKIDCSCNKDILIVDKLLAGSHHPVHLWYFLPKSTNIEKMDIVVEITKRK